MTIDEAVNILENYPPGASPDDSIEFNQAILLGIEALKHFKYHRDENIISFVKQLPGETKEDLT